MDPLRPVAPAADLLRVATEHAFTLRRAHEDGRREHGDLGLPFEAYAETALRHVHARLASVGLEATAARVAESLARAAGADLYLATACDQNAPGAWEAFVRGYQPRLVGLALKRGASPADADVVAGEIVGALALPPPRGKARTLLGTYDGSGGLFAWLAVSLVRRLAARGRARPVAPLPAEEESVASSPARAAPPDPSASLLDREAADTFERALADALEGLTDRERLALHLKYRDDLSGREIAPLLGVGEPRVSRLLGAALEKLVAAVRAHVKALVRGRGGDGEALWAALVSAVERRMATFPATAPPPYRGGSPQGHRHATG